MDIRAIKRTIFLPYNYSNTYLPSPWRHSGRTKKIPQMIKTNEVRRGNLVAYAIKDSKGNVPAAFKKPLIVDEIRDSFFMITDNLGFEMQFAESQLEGVPLTPGILKAMGFIWKSTDEGPQCEMKGTDFVLFDDGSVGVGGWVYSDFVHVGNSAKFLHQLQNLFFALTGEELNIPYKTF